MNHSEEGTDAKLAGCGVTVLVVLGLALLAIVVAVLYVLFNFGAFLGGL